MIKIKTGIVIASCLGLAACGSSQQTSYPGSGTSNTLIIDPTSNVSTGNFSTTDLQGSNWLAAYPSDQQGLIGTPTCGVKTVRM